MVHQPGAAAPRCHKSWRGRWETRRPEWNRKPLPGAWAKHGQTWPNATFLQFAHRCLADISNISIWFTENTSALAWWASCRTFAAISFLETIWLGESDVTEILCDFQLHFTAMNGCIMKCGPLGCVFPHFPCKRSVDICCFGMCGDRAVTGRWQGGDRAVTVVKKMCKLCGNARHCKAHSALLAKSPSFTRWKHSRWASASVVSLRGFLVASSGQRPTGLADFSDPFRQLVHSVPLVFTGSGEHRKPLNLIT